MSTIDFVAMMKAMREEEQPRANLPQQQQQPTRPETKTQLHTWPRFSMSVPTLAYATRLVNLGAVPSLRYVSDFVSLSEEQNCLLQTNACPASAWRDMKGRRLQSWGGVPDPLNGGQMSIEPLPPWLNTISSVLVDAGIFTKEVHPDHCLLNEYAPGQGILPHTDGPHYFPQVATLSLGRACLMHFRRRLTPDQIGEVMSEAEADRSQITLVLQPRSLVIFSEELYCNWLHSIEGPAQVVVPQTCINASQAKTQAGATLKPEPERAAQPRISLTFRRVIRD